MDSKKPTASIKDLSCTQRFGREVEEFAVRRDSAILRLRSLKESVTVPVPEQYKPG